MLANRTKVIILFVLCWPLASAAQAPAEAPVNGEPVTANPAATVPASDLMPAPDLFARDTFRIDTIVCPFKNQLNYEPGDIECGLLQVPENREKPESRFIELLFVKINAKPDGDEEPKSDNESESKGEADADTGLAPGKRDDPVIYFTGGPGVQVVSYVRRLSKHDIIKHRDLYILEQRGIGRSADFCPLYTGRNAAANQAETFEAYLQIQLDEARGCGRNAAMAGVDLSGYNTIENARDVRALRRALGLETWNVWGISYGSALGQAYIKVDPEGIRAAVLDAILPLDASADPSYWRIVKWYDRNLQKLDAACQADAACAARYPDLGTRARTATQGLLDNPIVVEAKDVERFPSGKARVFHDTAALLPFALFYEQDNYPALPAIIYAWADLLERRDETFFKALAQIPLPIAISRGMSNAVYCLDGYLDGQVMASRVDREEFPILGRANRDQSYFDQAKAHCLEVGLATRDRRDYTPVKTDIPTLIVEGEMDPITPPPLAKAILPGFSRGTYVEFPYAGHGPTRSVKCAGEMLNKFYDNPDAEPDLSCVDTMEAPQFFVPFFHTALVPRLLLRFIEDKKALIAPGLWFGLSTLIVLISFLSGTLGPLVRRIDGASRIHTYGATWAAWLAALCGSAAAVILAAAVGVTYETGTILLLFGLVPWAKFAAYAALLAGILGVATMVLTIRARRASKIPLGKVLGLWVTGMAAVTLSVFFLVWDLGPL